MGWRAGRQADGRLAALGGVRGRGPGRQVGYAARAVGEVGRQHGCGGHLQGARGLSLIHI
eukprot:1374032-Alexandrium_andersonii.AAC.1